MGRVSGIADYDIREEHFTSDLHSPVSYPVVNADLIREARKVFKKLKDIGNTMNGPCTEDEKKARWKKVDEMKKLEKFIRDKLAVDKNNFCFMENGNLTDHKVKWMIGVNIEEIKWTKLLITYGKNNTGLGEIPKDGQYMKFILTDRDV
jgi:hypothetical protein